MYKIGLRDGSPVSAGRMFESVVNQVSPVREGDIACIVGCELIYGPGCCPDALVSQVYTGPDTQNKRAIAMLLTEDMLLEAPVRGTDTQIATLTAGKFISFDVSNVDASGTSEYCQVMDTLGAKTAGDKILVRFIHNNKATT